MIKLRGATYHGILYHKGKQIWRSLKTSDKREAKIQYGKLLERQNSVPDNDMLWEEFSKKYLDWGSREKKPSSLENDERAIRFYRERCRPKLLSDFNRESIERYIKIRIDDGTTYATINRDLDTLCAMGAWAEDRDYVEVDPLRKIKKLKTPKRQPKPFRKEEIDLLRNACIDEFERIFIDLGYYTGRRLSEVLRIKRTQIDWVKRVIMTSGEDNRIKREGVVPLHPDLAKQIKKWYEVCSEGEFVIELHGRQVDSGYACDLFRRKICKRAGIKGSYHRLRHTFCSRLSEMDINQQKISNMAGHSSIITTQGYTAPNVESFRDAYEKAL